MIALPILYFARFAGKWVTADSSGAFRTWFAAEWPVELVIGLAGAIAFGLAAGYREWRVDWDSFGKRDDRYEP